ncbi:MAG: class I SAM-dependent methyltransferase [Candidatus Aminicenantes bacterium]|nr:class I SAM-dependent methyltransferase [Candidatus Aminicenantes bacterium]
MQKLESPFLWTVDQYQRYAVLREFLREISLIKNDQSFIEKEKGGQIKVLDVGGLSPLKDGSGYWLPLEAICQASGLTLDLAYYPLKGKRLVQGNALHLPFADHSIEVVAALDVLEHIAPSSRETFIAELCRVAAHSVVLSAPFASTEIERADQSLSKLIKEIYGVEHRQLQDHLEKGLPPKETVTAWLKGRMPAGVEFSFGSLSRWLAFQSLRFLFLDYFKKAEIFDLLDCFWLSFSQREELTPPFSRHFWIYSRRLDLKALEAIAEKILDQLQKESFQFSLEEAITLTNLILDSKRLKGISAMVISEGDEDDLTECLHHLLSQKIETFLEVAVWVIRGKISPHLKNNFPGVKFYWKEEPCLRLNQLNKIILSLKGDWILLLNEKILLPADTVSLLHQKAKRLQERNNLCPVLSPRLIEGKRKYGVWCGRNFSPLKLVVGWLQNPTWIFSSQRASWLFSECLFFPKEAVFYKQNKKGKVKKKDFFLWAKESPALKFFYQPEIIVYRRASRNSRIKS